MHSDRGLIDLCDGSAVRRDLKSRMQRGLVPSPTLHPAKLKLICSANLYSLILFLHLNVMLT
jgi:hypothetical protein